MSKFRRSLGPDPLEHHQHPVAEADEIEDVDAAPGEPGRQPPKPQLADIADGIGAAHRGEIALVEIAEWTRSRRATHTRLKISLV